MSEADEADNIIFEYSRPYSTIDSENLYFAACVYQAAYIELQANLKLAVEALEFIANGCLVEPDGGSPGEYDAIDSAREALAKIKGRK